jgi:tRNA(adenine34) deaminase
MFRFLCINLSVIFLLIATGCSNMKSQVNTMAQTPQKQVSSSFRTIVESKMKELIADAKEKNPQFPFAAMIIETETGKEICRGVNNSSSNPTLHGEIATINNCVNSYGRENLNWPSLTLITTAEPCPMCQGAIIWAGFGRVVYGTSIARLIEKGWRQIDINSHEMCKRSTFNKPEIIGGILSEETDSLFIDRNIK